MKELIYVGGYSNCITIFEFENGKLEYKKAIDEIEKPSYLCINKNVLYAVSETNSSKVSAYKIFNESYKKISLINSDRLKSCHISTNFKRDRLLVSNYGSGSIDMYQISQDGRIGEKIASKFYINSNIHFSKFVNDNIFSVDLNNNKIYVYDSNLNEITHINIDKNSGPRHVVFNDDFIYIITELSNQIIVLKNNKIIQRISTLKNKDIVSYGGAIKISKDKKFIYATNRGEDTIAVFLNNNGYLKLIQSIPSGGEFPRDISFNQTEEYVFVANQFSNSITVFKRNIKHGTLEQINNENINIEKPACIIRSIYEI